MFQKIIIVLNAVLFLFFLLILASFQSVMAIIGSPLVLIIVNGFLIIIIALGLYYLISSLKNKKMVDQFWLRWLKWVPLLNALVYAILIALIAR